MFFCVYYPNFAASPEEDGAQPTLHFSLYYDLQRQVLTIHLHKATNLPAKDQRCTSNPFVVAYVEPSKVEICHSKIIYKTLNPTFDEMFEFKNLTPDEVRKQTIVFRIYNHDKYAKSDFIGAVVLPLREADLLGVTVGVIIDEKADTFRVGYNFMKFRCPLTECATLMLLYRAGRVNCIVGHMQWRRKTFQVGGGGGAGAARQYGCEGAEIFLHYVTPSTEKHSRGTLGYV